MADHELDPVADELVGDRHALLGIGHVVADLDLDLLPQNAAGLVDVLGRLLDALHELRAESRVGAGDRARDPQLDLSLGGPGEPKRERNRHGRECDRPHFNLQKYFDGLGCAR